jgi:PAS domain S-box-containing protein
LLFEANPQAMWVYDLTTLRFLAVNDAAVRHYGYSRAEFLDMTIKDIRPPEDVKLLEDYLASKIARSRMQANGDTARKTARYQRRDHFEPLTFGGVRRSLCSSRRHRAEESGDSAAYQ